MNPNKKDQEFNIWIGLRSSDYQIFDNIVPIHQVISVDFGDTSGIPIISTEFIKKERTTWAIEELFKVTQLKQYKDLIEKLINSKKQVHMYFYYSIPELEDLAKKYKNFHAHTTPTAIKRVLDDKFKFRDLLDKLKIPNIESIIAEINKVTYNDLIKKLDQPLVIKQKSGESGGGTHMIANKKEFLDLQKRLGAEKVLISKFIHGPSFNVSGFIGKKVYLAPPSFQIIGVPESAFGKFDYCGNDFAAVNGFSEKAKKLLIQSSMKIAKYAQKKGFYGIFGIDLIYDTKNEIMYPLEINPRMQGSTPILVRYQQANNITPITSLYVDESLEEKNYKVNASFILVHNINKTDMIMKNSLKNGIYKFSHLPAGRQEKSGKVKLTYLGNPYPYPKKEDEVLLVGCPTNGTLVKRGAGTIRMEFTGSILDNNHITLKPFYSKIVKGFFNSLWI